MTDEVEAFEGWYERSWRPLLAAVLTSGAGPDEAEDALAEAFARALIAWSRVSLMERPEGWVYRVATNVIRRRHRRARLEEMLLRRRASLAATNADLGSERPGTDGRHDPIWGRVAALPPRQREAIVRRYLLDMTQDEVAKAMHISPGTAAATLHAGRERLRAAMENTDTGEVAG